MKNDVITIELEGVDFIPHLAKVWDLLARDGHRFEHFRVGNTNRPLTHDPLGRLAVWTKKRSTVTLSLESEDPDGASLYLTRFKGMEPSLRLRFRWRERTVDAWLDWLESLLALGEVQHGTVAGPDTGAVDVFFAGPSAGWLFICGGALRRKLEQAGVIDFLARREGGFVRRKKRSLLVGLTPSPLEALADGDAVTDGGTRLMVEACERKAKVDVLKLGRAELQRVLGPRGFTEAPGANRLELRFRKDAVTVVAQLELWDDAPTYSLSARLAVSPTSYFPWSLAEGPLAKARQTLTRGLALYEAQEARFLKNPRKFK